MLGAITFFLTSMLLADQTLQQSIDTNSAKYLGVPYILDPLGEGKGSSIDSDPKFRFDAFDCTTYVETVMALSLSKSEGEFERLMDEIRYSSSEHSYFTRNHFIETDWMPNALSKKFIQDSTSQIFGPTLIKNLSIEIDRSFLFKKKKINAPTEQKKSAQIPYITIASLIQDKSLFDNIPSGTFFNLIKLKPNKSGAIVHQGIFIRKDKHLFVRHASTLSQHKVFDMDAISFYLMHLNHQREERVKILGINLFSLVGRP